MSEEDASFRHPKLGELYAEDVDWQIDAAPVSFWREPIEACLAEGGEGGPSNEALEGYDWIEANWPRVLELIQEQAFEFYRPYADAVAQVPTCTRPEQLWGTEQLLSLRVFAKDDFTVSMRFEWQQSGDPRGRGVRDAYGRWIAAQAGLP